MIVKLKHGFVVRTPDGKRNLSKEGLTYEQAVARQAQCDEHANRDKQKKK